MPPNTAAPAAGSSSSSKKESSGSHKEKERVGNYIVGAEIGRGSFATVFKGYRSKTRAPIAIKAVSRQKLTPKLLENLESEINILKAIQHKNVVALEDCFKNDHHIYLIMDFCSGGDLSMYIKNRGKHPTLDFVPRPRGARSDGTMPTEGDKIFWPHPASGGLDEKVTRSFLGQLALAVQFLRTQNLIHRDIKPQNLLMQPATAADIAEGHPLGIPILKVADFGFARILPAAAMAETLCGSPLYMAPEILRYEKYDAKADLWSVGAVLFEMAVGRPPFRANNHVELLRKIEKGEDKIKFPDESSRTVEHFNDDGDPIPAPEPVPSDIKTLIRDLLKRQPAQRMGFESFFACGVWDGYMSESVGEGSTSISASTSTEESIRDLRRSEVQDLIASAERNRTRDVRVGPTHAAQPISSDPALNPQPAVVRDRSPQVVAPPPLAPIVRPIRRSEPKYYVSNETSEVPSHSPTSPLTPATSNTNTTRAGPRPIITAAARRMSSRNESVEEATPITPSSLNGPAPVIGLARGTRGVSEGSPLAATPPMTMEADEHTGKDESTLESSDSILGREYVVVEKRAVEINKLADDVDYASSRRNTVVRRPSSRTSVVVSRPVSSLKPPAPPSPPPQASIVPLSYSPPFAFSSTPPFAIPPTVRKPSTLSRPSSIPQSLNVFPPPPIVGAHYATDNSLPRYGTSPSSLQTGALARALTNTAIRFIGTAANQGATVLARVTNRRIPTLLRITANVDPLEDQLLDKLEDLARKSFALFDLGDLKMAQWAKYAKVAGGYAGTGTTPPFAQSISQRRSSSSSNSDVQIMRHQEGLAGEATILYLKALLFIMKGSDKAQRYFENRSAGYEMTRELIDVVQWFRARFNEVYDKAESVKSLCGDDLPFVDKIIYDRAKEVSRQAAIQEMSGDLINAETGYESSVWLLNTLLDDVLYDGGHIKDEDRVSVDTLIGQIRCRWEALKKKIAETSS